MNRKEGNEKMERVAIGRSENTDENEEGKKYVLEEGEGERESAAGEEGKRVIVTNKRIVMQVCKAS